LPARINWIDEEFTLLDGRTARIVRRNLGTIIADESRPIRLCEGAAVGEVDETFADRLKPGDRFLLDGRCLEFRHSDGRELLVEETAGSPPAPRWQGSGWPLSTDLARRLYLLRHQAAESLCDGPSVLARLLCDDYGVDGRAAARLMAYFQLQECVSEIPDPTTFLVEVVSSEFGMDYYLHTPLNRSGNDALARVAVHRLARDHGRRVTSIVADLGCLLSITSGHELTPDAWQTVFTDTDFDADLNQALADSITLRERFRCVALTSLMLLRSPLGARRRVGGRDWAERRLFEQVRARDPEFVLLRQALREVQGDALDVAAARSFLEKLPRMTSHWRYLTQVSPFAESWTQQAAGPVELVDSPEEALKRLHAVLMHEG
jgi:ATP-dependent Lhr-like helicase